MKTIITDIDINRARKIVSNIKSNWNLKKEDKIYSEIAKYQPSIYAVFAVILMSINNEMKNILIYYFSFDFV